MITKILTIKISKEDKTTKTVDDVLKVYRGPDTESVILEAPVTSRQVVDKKDIIDAIRAIEEFYGDSPKTQATKLEPCELTQEEKKSLVELENKELEAAQKDTYFVVQHGDDNS